MHSNDLHVKYTPGVAGCLHIYISRKFRLVSKNNHHLAILHHLKQGFDIDQFHYNDFISPRAHFLYYSSYLGVCIFVWKVA